MLSEAKHLWLALSALVHTDDQRFFASLRMTGGIRLNHPELHPARFADHVLIPGWVPDELHIGFIDAVYA
jgi:hypothetical protein